MTIPKSRIDAESALRIFQAAPDDALVKQEIVAAVLSVSPATLEKARCVGDTGFPVHIKIGARVRYRVGTVRKHLAGLDERGGGCVMVVQSISNTTKSW